MEYLKQSTAATVKLGPFLDETDGKTSEAALTISQADIRLSKNGGAFAQTNNVAGATHDEKGWYGVPLNTTDTGTLGRLKVAIHESGALPCFAEFMVVTANIYDSLCSTDKFQVDVTQLLGTAWLSPGTAGTPDVNAKKLGGTAQTGRDVGADVLLSSGSGAGQLDFTSGVVKSNLAQILGTALTETAGWLAAGFKKLFNVATPVLVASDVMRGTDSANTTVPDAAGTAPTKTEIVDEWETQAAADPTGFKVNVMEVNGTAQTANDNGADINAILTDTGTTLDTLIKDVPTVAEFNARTIASADYVVVGDTLAAVTSAGLSATAVDAIWDELLTGAAHNTATSAGRRLRQAADVMIIREETCQAGGGNDEVILDASASAVNDFYIYDLVVLTSGTGAGQQRHIDSYVGATKTCTVNRNWTTNPDATTECVIKADSSKHVHGFLTEAKAEINTEVDTGLSDINLDHLMKTAVANNADMTIEVADGTVLSNMLSKTSDTSTYAVADDSLEANRDHATTIKSETALIVGDTNELQTDWVNGGRLDLLLDAVKAKTDNQPAGIPKNVALANFSVLMVLSSDHITPATGKTLIEEISKDGGAFAACANAAAEIGNGAYKISLTQAEMNADVIILKFTEANCDQRTVVIKTSS